MQGKAPQNTSGLTTRQLRHQPRLIINTGDGKGKSTAAFGMALRAWNQGWSIGVYQFVKSPNWRTGEKAAFAALNEVHQQTGQGGPVEWHAMGAGWTWLRSTKEVDHVAMSKEGWARISEQLANQTHDLYVLDEFSYVLANGWLDVDEVLETLANRPGTQHVVMTGRRMPQQVLDAADLVTEMTKVKHPFDTGAKGQAGIEW
ncbi:cob(I)yrinic acid a,c-diamide adenosyltransferase [Luteococcus sediminum]|uniref:cob(I)yrinic acid a,c-diamide adenosyltransferase n=1 Tax=Luteococcus sp. TaxID=1969402 RepID=UPI003736005A